MPGPDEFTYTVDYEKLGAKLPDQTIPGPFWEELTRKLELSTVPFPVPDHTDRPHRDRRLCDMSVFVPIEGHDDGHLSEQRGAAVLYAYDLASRSDQPEHQDLDGWHVMLSNPNVTGEVWQEAAILIARERGFEVNSVTYTEDDFETNIDIDERFDTKHTGYDSTDHLQY